MKVLLSLFHGMEVKPNLRRLLCGKACLGAFQGGEKVKVVRGTRIEEVSKE